MNESSETAEAAASGARYSSAAQAMHWLSAALVLFAVPCAWYMLSLVKGDPARAEWHVIHRSVGMLILLLSAARLLWRSVAPPPPMVGHRQPWEKILAEAAHALLYVVLFVMPLSGYVSTVAEGRPVPFFGLFTFPSLLPVDKDLAHVADLVHGAGQWAVYGLVGLHVLAAMVHAVVRKDGMLRRMLPAWLAR
jgi:cytochrome b561